MKIRINDHEYEFTLRELAEAAFGTFALFALFFAFYIITP